MHDEPGWSEPRDYHTGFDTCPATVALDSAQAEIAASDEAAHQDGLRPENARTWFVWTDAEGEPM